MSHTLEYRAHPDVTIYPFPHTFKEDTLHVSVEQPDGSRIGLSEGKDYTVQHSPLGGADVYLIKTFPEGNFIIVSDEIDTAVTPPTPHPSPTPYPVPSPYPSAMKERGVINLKQELPNSNLAVEFEYTNNHMAHSIHRDAHLNSLVIASFASDNHDRTLCHISVGQDGSINLEGSIHINGYPIAKRGESPSIGNSSGAGIVNHIYIGESDGLENIRMFFSRRPFAPGNLVNAAEVCLPEFNIYENGSSTRWGGYHPQGVWECIRPTIPCVEGNHIGWFKRRDITTTKELKFTVSDFMKTIMLVPSSEGLISTLNLARGSHLTRVEKLINDMKEDITELRNRPTITSGGGVSVDYNELNRRYLPRDEITDTLDKTYAKQEDTSRLDTRVKTIEDKVKNLPNEFMVRRNIKWVEHKVSPNYVHFELEGGGTAGVHSFPSDERVKDIRGSSTRKALEAINKIKHICFNFKENQGYDSFHTYEVGYSAQQLITIDDSWAADPMGVCYHVVQSSILPWITKAIQELHAEVVDLRKEKQELESRMEREKQELNSIIVRFMHDVDTACKEALEAKKTADKAHSGAEGLKSLIPDSPIDIGAHGLFYLCKGRTPTPIGSAITFNSLQWASEYPTSSVSPPANTGWICLGSPRKGSSAPSLFQRVW